MRNREQGTRAGFQSDKGRLLCQAAPSFEEVKRYLCLPRGFKEEPRAPFRLVDPDLIRLVVA